MINHEILLTSTKNTHIKQYMQFTKNNKNIRFYATFTPYLLLQTLYYSPIVGKNAVKGLCFTLMHPDAHVSYK